MTVASIIQPESLDLFIKRYTNKPRVQLTFFLFGTGGCSFRSFPVD